MGMLVKHMRNHNLGDLRSATCPPPPIHTPRDLARLWEERATGEKLSVPVLTWQRGLRLRRKKSTHPRLRVNNLVYYSVIKIV